MAGAFTLTLREDGMTYKQIAERLNEGGFKTSRGKEFSAMQVKRLIDRYPTKKQVCLNNSYLCNMKKRVTFNLNNFIMDLYNCYIHETYDLIDDVVQRYKDFLSHTKPEIAEKSRVYLMKHWVVMNDETGTLASYIVACHKKNKGI